MSLPHALNPLIPAPQGEENVDQLAFMIEAKPYLAFSPYLDRLRNEAAVKLHAINTEPDGEKRMALWKKHANTGEGVFIVQGLFCEYGFNITFAGDNFIGANCSMVDVCPIYIGKRTMIGPDSKIYTPDHPLSPEARAGMGGQEWGKPVVIEDDCWICGAVIILPGVTIGNGSTIGAGSVVTKDIPPRSVAVGNPARVIKRILEDGTTLKV